MHSTDTPSTAPIDNHSILITGCSSGMGYETAVALHRAGYNVIASCRDPADVARLQGEGLFCVQLDLRDSDSIARAVADTLAHTGGTLYALFNNGAYGQPGAVEDLPRAALREQFETNLFGWHELTCALLPVMRRQGYGRIIQNSSILGLVAMKYRGAYNASKFALEGLTDTLRLELRGSGIHVSLIEPGPVATRFRPNALAAFERNIALNDSVHQAAYQQQISRLSKAGISNRFTLSAESVVPLVRHALESPRPKARYPLTTPTTVFSILRRVLPVRWLDALLARGD
ncbi:SDR family oxidoreductase [Plesiomonas shigelloides]|uniref:SDR family oxidoreductase n=1 Tax=Plesiomonas shigelloides TaxID=703 RepID=UPI00387F0BC8